MTPPLQTLSLEQLATATGGRHRHGTHRTTGAEPPTQLGGTAPITAMPPMTPGTPIVPSDPGGVTTPNGRTASSYRRSFNH